MKKQQHNKAVPKLRFREFREDRGWGLKALNDLGEIVTGKTPSTKEKELWDGNILFITPTDLNDNNKYQEKAERTILKTDNIRILPVGSIAYTCIASIGKIAITSKPSITNQQINSIIVNRKFNSEFIYYSLIHLTPYIKIIPATSTLPIINKSEFSRIQVLIPTVREQQKIASCLSSLDDVIELESEKLTALRAHKKGLLQKLFPAEGKKAPELRFREFRKNGEWEEKKLGEIADYSSKRIPLNELELDSYISTENILPDYRGITKSSKLPNNGSFTKYEIGDILVSNIRPYLKKIWMANKEGGASNDILVFKGKLGINKIFLSFILKNDRFIKAMMQGARGVKMPRGDKFLIISYPIFLPTLKEQEKIASCLSSIDELIESQSKMIEQLKNHKKGLMQGLFPEEE